MTISVMRYCSGRSSRCGGDRARGFSEVERALARYPLDSIRPMDRPYFGLVYVSGLAGKAGRARELVTEYQRVVDPRYQARARGDLARARGRIALAERRWHDAIASLWRPRPVSLPQLMVGRSWRERTMFSEKPIPRSPSTSARYDSGWDEIHHRCDQLPRTYWRLGELYAQRGDLKKAIEAYGRFIELWRNCDPELRPQVAEARRRLAELSTRG